MTRQPASSPASSDERLLTDESIGIELFWEKHKNLILLSALALLLITILALGIWVHLELRRSAAASALANATTLEQLNEVRKKFPGSPPAAVASILAAVLVRESGDLEASTQELQQFTTAHPNSPLRPIARLAIAQNALAKGDSESALAIFRELGTGTDPFITPLARLFEARELIARKEWLEARSILQSILSEFPNSISSQIARGQLEMLTLVEPPEAPQQITPGSEDETQNVAPPSPAEPLTPDQSLPSTDSPTPGSMDSTPATQLPATTQPPTDGSPSPDPANSSAPESNR